MGMCPVCNGFQQLISQCRLCGHNMEDSGRVMDFYDDYSAYMEIDSLKLEDGYPNTLQKCQCPHLVSCQNCGASDVIFIQE